MSPRNAEPAAAPNSPRARAQTRAHAPLERGALIAFLALWVLIKIVLRYFIPRDSTPLRGVSTNAYFIYQYLLLLIAGAVAFRRQLSRAARRAWDNKLRTAGAIVAGCALMAVTDFLVSLMAHSLASLGDFGANSLNDDNLARSAANLNGGVELCLFFATVALTGPIVEELFFRQFLIDFLEDHIPVWAAVVITGALFGAYHMHAFTLPELINALPQMSSGIVLGAIYVLTKRNIHASCAVHIANNLPPAVLFLF